jgi:hypothetical protein
MTISAKKSLPEVPFPVAPQRFDQKNEMFKRSQWDEKMQSHGMRFNREVKFREKVGYRQLDYALSTTSWAMTNPFLQKNSGILVNESVEPVSR